MLKQIYATKLDMTQAWTTQGQRLPVTRCRVEANRVVGVRSLEVKSRAAAGPALVKVPCQMVEVAYGQKKAKQMTKPLRTKLAKANFDTGAVQLRGLRDYTDQTDLKAGDTLNLADLFAVGDVVEVQGTSKGKGFAGVMKRHNFAGGPATHGQSDRARAPGSIGQRTQPGRVHKGHHMAGHMGSETVTVGGLTVVHLDPQTNEVWLSGPIPGANNGILRLTKTGQTKKIELDPVASGLPTPIVAEAAPQVEETAAPVEEGAAS